VVAGRHLDEETVTLVGMLHTISDTTNWDMQTDDGERIRIRRGDIPDEVTASLHVRERVVVEASVRVRLQPGGVERAEYTALSVRPADGEHAGDLPV
jgi:hypothetical protein